MTLEQALHTVDELKPNQYERARKIAWLDNLDRQVYRDVMLRHENKGDVPEAFQGYKQDTDPDTELLVKAPHDEVYRYWLEMHIDLANQEYEKYNNSAALASEALGAFKRAWHREHRMLEPEGAHLGF